MDVAAIITALTGAVVGLNSVLIGRVRKEVKSPNGSTTAVKVDSINGKIDLINLQLGNLVDQVEAHILDPTLHCHENNN